MLVAHLSDLHVFADAPETAQVRPDIARAVARIVEDMTTLPRRIDLVLVSGDVADGGSEADYALVRRLLAPLEAPVVVVPGNHDRRETMRAAFRDRVAFEDGPFLNVAGRFDACAVIGLDTTIPGEVAGELCETRLDWFERALARADRPTFVVAHHPPFPTGNAHWDATALVRGGVRLEAIVRRASVPVCLLTGHVHQAMHATFAGHYAAIGGSPAFSYGFAIGSTTEPALEDTPYAYFLHHCRADGTIGVYQRHVALG